MCSSAFPGFLPHQQVNGQTYFDGGVLRNTDIGGAIEACRQIVDNDEDIIVDVIMPNALPLVKDDLDHYNAINMYMRKVENKISIMIELETFVQL